MMFDKEKDYLIKKIKIFESKIIFSNKCWHFNHCLNRGYGQMKFKGKTIKAHHFSLLIYKNIDFKKQKKGLVTDHICNNRSCVNPDHLRIITNKENSLRGRSFCAINSRKTQCSNGHIFSEKSFYIYRERRICKLCFAYNSAIKRAKKKLKRNLNEDEIKNIFKKIDKNRSKELISL